MANVLVGRALGYPDAASFVLFWCALALAATVGWRIARRIGYQGSVDTLLATLVIASAVIVSVIAVTGAMGWLHPPAVFAIQTVIGVAALWLQPRAVIPASDHKIGLIPVAALAIISTLLVYSVAFAAWHPFTLYDSPSYHLYFPARWVQDGRIAIIATPFSDPAQAYAPANGEIWFAWLMLPFHGDLVARMGQLPFALMAAVVLYGIARHLGAGVAHAVYPAAFFLLSRPVVEQMVGAHVDLICAAYFLTAIHFGLAAVDRDQRRDWVLCGISVGLFLGTKYLALVYAPVLALLVFARGPRRRALWAVPGILLFGLPWYLRNWIIAGSPLYPSSLSVAGITLARGAFDRTAMLNTVFHTGDVRLLPVIAAHGFGPALFLVWLPCAIGGWIVMARRGWWPHRMLVALPLLMLALFWLALPVNIESRFLLPAIGPAMLPLAFVFSIKPRWHGLVHVAYILAMVWLIVGADMSLPGTAPWFMAGWLALDGLVTRRFLPWFVVTTTVTAALWLATRKTPRLAVPTLLIVMASGATVFTLETERLCGIGPCEFLQTTSPYIRPDYLESWRWIDDHITDATIAYTGINLPYPLTGRRLTNRVVYVNIDGRPRWRLHDYDRAYRSGRFAPTPPYLAISSGELMSVPARVGPRDDASRPRYERMQGNRDAWVFNLERMGIRYLFVANLSAYEIDYVWHNGDGFPIEDDWARAAPERFQLVYRNHQVRIYAFDADRRNDG